MRPSWSQYSAIVHVELIDRTRLPHWLASAECLIRQRQQVSIGSPI